MRQTGAKPSRAEPSRAMHHGLVAGGTTSAVLVHPRCQPLGAGAPVLPCNCAPVFLRVYRCPGRGGKLACKQGGGSAGEVGGMCGRAPERRRRKLAPKEKRRCCALHPRVSDAQPRVQASGCAGSGGALRVQPGLSGTARPAWTPSTAAPHLPHAELAPAALTCGLQWRGSCHRTLWYPRGVLGLGTRRLSRSAAQEEESPWHGSGERGKKPRKLGCTSHLHS